MISNKKKEQLLIENKYDYEKTYLDLKKMMNYRISEDSRMCKRCKNSIVINKDKYCTLIGVVFTPYAEIDLYFTCDDYKQIIIR